MQETIGHYQVVRKLGSGGMGEVLLAEDTKLHRQVALKLLPPDVADDPLRRRRLLDEAHAASVLSHPNICVIHEIGEDEGTPYITMEYIDGVPLSDRIAAGTLPTCEILDITIQMADAVDAAHDAGIIHRDLKPANVLLTPRGHVKILDFGLAKLNAPVVEPSGDSITQLKSTPGMVIGTLQYMSPEQALGRPVDRRTDIFSLGVILYEMATGRRPFAGNSPTEVVDRVVHEEPTAIGPPEFNRIVRKCLEKDRDRRYQSARELFIDLRNLKRDSESGERRPIVKRRPWAWLLAAAVLAVVAAAAIVHYARPATAIDSVAVLPFVNSSGSTDAEYLSDGITESIINTLSQVRGLRVVPRTSVFRFKGKESDPEKIGHELNVAAVLSGRLTQRGNSLIVQTEFIDVRKDAQLWGEQYNRPLADIVALQQEIAQQISDKLRLQISSAEQQQIAKLPTRDAEAYELYLKGRYEWNKRTPEGLRAAMDFLQRAVERDPNFALAYVGLADAYAVSPQTLDTPTREATLRAKETVERALAIDSSIAEAHATLGLIEDHLYKWQAAEQEFKRAIELKPNYATAHHWYCLHLTDQRRFDEALREIKRAHALDPLSSVIALNIAYVYFFDKKYELALAAAKSTVEGEPRFAIAHSLIGLILLLKGQQQEAIRELRVAADLGRFSWTLADLAYGLGVVGNRKEARQIITELQARERQHKTAPGFLVAPLLAIGERENAIAEAGKEVDSGGGWTASFALDPRYDPLRSDPRFMAILHRAGL
jgi:eukaryotic-like serine/threonine-protein kinase